jgi:hypothetical protein
MIHSIHIWLKLNEFIKIDDLKLTEFYSEIFENETVFFNSFKRVKWIEECKYASRFFFGAFV